MHPKTKVTYPTRVTDWATDDPPCSKNSHAVMTMGSEKITWKKNLRAGDGVTMTAY